MENKSTANEPESPRHYGKSPITFLLLTLLAQVVSCGALLLLVQTLSLSLALDQSAGSYFTFAAGLIVYGSVGWGCASFLGLPPLWRIFNALLFPLVILAETFAIPNWAYFIGVVAALILYLPTIWTRVPYYPTSLAMYEAVLLQLPKDKSYRFIDLGCGFAGLLCYLAQRNPQSSFVGVELSPLAYILSKLRVHLAGVKNVEIQFKNIWTVPLKDYTVVYAFLAPPPMAGLWEKVTEEMPGSGLLLVNCFPVPGVPAKEIKVIGKRQTALYRYENW